VVLGIGLVDRWASGLVARLRSGGHAGDVTAWLAVLTVALVALAAVVFGFVPAIVVGFVLSGALFIVGMNRSLVRSVVDATVRPSRRVWGGQDAVRLADVRRRIRVVELEGALFFGSAERLSEIVEPLAGVASSIVLDFRHVTALDATGALVVERLARRVVRRGTHLLLAGVTPEGRHGRTFLAHNAFVDPTARLWFADADQAIEWAEQRGLAASGRVPLDEAPLDGSDLLAGLDATAVALVRPRLIRRTVAAGETLFREGDPGDGLYLIARGAIEISIEVRGGRRTRIVTMAEGAIFGEAALLDGRPRSATALAIEPSIVYELTREALLRDLAQHAPAVAIHLMLNLARVLSLRMRETNEILRRLEESRG
jgi:SulP family sulfate permease